MTTTCIASRLVHQLAQHHPLVEAVPDPLADQERRAEARYETLTGPIELDLVWSDGSTARALLYDISTRGARIIADHLPPNGQHLRLRFGVGESPVEIDGVVMHVSDDSEEHYFGVEFVPEWTTADWSLATPARAST